MNKLALAVALLSGVIAVPLALSRYFENVLCRRYPDLDRKAVREAYAQFLTNFAKGDYGDSDYVTLEKMYPLLDAIVRERTATN